MTSTYSGDEALNELHERFHRLMETQRDSVRNGKKAFYSLDAHEYLQQEHLYGLGAHKRDIMLPMPREQWYPKELCDRLEKYYSSSRLHWPIGSHYEYSMNCMMLEALGSLYFGYALCGEEIIPCAFFVWFLMTGTLKELPGELIPEEYVIDPLALASGKKPECYIGISIPNHHVEEWILGGVQHPLETYVAERNAIRLEDSSHNHELLMGEHAALSNTPEENKKIVELWLCRR